MTMNVMVLAGRLGKMPMIREFPDGGCVTNFSLAHDRFKGVGASRTKVTDWHNCVARDHTARFLCEHAMQGQSLTVKGRLVVNTFEREGSKEEVRVVEIDVEDVELGRRPKASMENGK